MATVSSTDSINARSIIWLAYCSNPVRTVEECVTRTNEVIAAAGVADRELLSATLGKLITTVCLNRGSDDIIASLFNIDNSPLALGCVETAMDSMMRGFSNIDVRSYIDKYATRYGENRDYLVIKLRWLTLYTNYPDNIAESERIITALTTTEVA